jgi:hypothetical protein
MAAEGRSSGVSDTIASDLRRAVALKLVCLFGNTTPCAGQNERDLVASKQRLEALLFADSKVLQKKAREITREYQRQGKPLSPFQVLAGATGSLAPLGAPQPPGPGSSSRNVYDYMAARFLCELAGDGKMDRSELQDTEDILICTVPSSVRARPDAFREILRSAVPYMHGRDQMKRAGIEVSQADDTLRRAWLRDTSLLWYCTWPALSRVLEGDTVRNAFQVETGTYMSKRGAAGTTWSEYAPGTSQYLRKRFMAEMLILPNLPTDYADCRFDACRPVSCFLFHDAWRSNPDAGGPRYNMTDTYGNIVVRLREEIKERCTFTLFDSLSMIFSSVDPAKWSYSFSYIPRVQPREARFVRYVEAQIWGGEVDAGTFLETWLDPHLPISIQRRVLQGCWTRGIPVFYSDVYIGDRIATEDEYYTEGDWKVSRHRRRRDVPIMDEAALFHIGYVPESVSRVFGRRPEPLASLPSLRFMCLDMSQSKESAAAAEEGGAKELELPDTEAAVFDWAGEQKADVSAVQGMRDFLGGTAVGLADHLQPEEEVSVLIRAMPGLDRRLPPHALSLMQVSNHLRVASVAMSRVGKPPSELMADAFDEFRLAPLHAAVQAQVDIVAGNIGPGNMGPAQVYMRDHGYALAESLPNGTCVFFREDRLRLAGPPRKESPMPGVHALVADFEGSRGAVGGAPSAAKDLSLGAER